MINLRFREVLTGRPKVLSEQSKQKVPFCRVDFKIPKANKIILYMMI